MPLRWAPCPMPDQRRIALRPSRIGQPNSPCGHLAVGCPSIGPDQPASQSRRHPTHETTLRHPAPLGQEPYCRQAQGPRADPARDPQGQAASQTAARRHPGLDRGFRHADLANRLGIGLAAWHGGRADHRCGQRLFLCRPARGRGSVRRPRARQRHHAGPRRARLCLARRDLWRGRQQPDRPGPARGGDLGRGPAVLSPPGRQPARHRQRHPHQPGRGPRPAGGEWRVHHHAAGRQALVPGRHL